uniref:nucleoside-diphosphate kinase n=1 Tax=Erpetoichthys calabaricus TaxID=27687 RepID=A0A8C4RWZ1_ERPCA
MPVTHFVFNLNFQVARIKIRVHSNSEIICKMSSMEYFASSFNISIMAGTEEHNFITVKPDGVQRGLMGKIIKRFEQKGLRGDFCIQVGRNIIYGSDPVESVKKMISLYLNLKNWWKSKAVLETGSTRNALL